MCVVFILSVISRVFAGDIGFFYMLVVIRVLEVVFSRVSWRYSSLGLGFKVYFLIWD